MTSSLPEIEAFGITDIGKVREDNQDCIRTSTVGEEDDAGHLYAVADGMGGYEHGGIASTLALETFLTTVQGTAGSVAASMKRGVTDANLRVFQESARQQARMGTTLSAFFLAGNTLQLVHVGDSRVYLLRGGTARCLTNDHTTVGEMVRARVLSPDKVRTHSNRSVLNRCLGMQLFIQVDTAQVTLQSGDVLVACTDGLWSAIEDDEIARVAAPHLSVQEISELLLQTALNNDSDDNISMWVVRARKLPDAMPPVEKRRGFPVHSLLKRLRQD